MDTSFIDVIKEENISKIDIDERLIEPFKQALIAIQKYFNDKGYTEKNNYGDYLNKYLLEESDRKLKIRISDKLLSGVCGSYSAWTNELLVNEDSFANAKDELPHIICHEFIHFLVHHEIEYLYANAWSGEIFVDEGYTEHLAEEIIPCNSDYYGPIPNLLNFFNELLGNKDNYLLLLNHKVPDMMRQKFYPNSFIIHGNDCISKFKEGYYLNGGYEYDSDYLNIQRNIIESSNLVDVNNYDDFTNLISLLNKRPAIDQEWIVNYVLSKCSNIINENEDIKRIITNYINASCDLRKYNGEDVYEFNVGDNTLVFDGNSIHGIPEGMKYWFTWRDGQEVLEFTDDQDNIVYFDYKNADITARRNNLNNKMIELTELLESRIKNKEI